MQPTRKIAATNDGNGYPFPRNSRFLEGGVVKTAVLP